MPSLKSLLVIAPAGSLAGAVVWYLSWKLFASLVLSLILGGVVALGLPALWILWLMRKRRPAPALQPEGELNRAG